MQFLISPDLREAISFASWQNSVPLLASLSVKNASQDPASNLELTVSNSSGYLKKKVWKIDRLLAGDELVISDCSVEFVPAYLSGLNEAEKTELLFELSKDGEVLATAEQDIRVLARDEWGGLGQGGELLAAFVMPNDPFVASVLKSAAKILQRHGHSAALDGYQSKDPQRAYLLASAVWNAICGLKLTYANPPASFETVGQKTRTPQTIADQGLATCLDSSLLFASVIEAVGLNPIVVFTDCHCFAGVWLSERTFNQIIEPEPSELRKAIFGHELVTFETTLVTHSPAPRFEDAVKQAKSATQEAKEGEFVAAIDIRRARMAKITPLASHMSTLDDEQISSPEVQSEFLPLAAPPELAGIPSSVAEEKPTAANGRN